jgi:hypothetical protein
MIIVYDSLKWSDHKHARETGDIHFFIPHKSFMPYLIKLKNGVLAAAFWRGGPEF